MSGGRYQFMGGQLESVKIRLRETESCIENPKLSYVSSINFAGLSPDFGSFSSWFIPLPSWYWKQERNGDGIEYNVVRPPSFRCTFVLLGGANIFRHPYPLCPLPSCRVSSTCEVCRMLCFKFTLSSLLLPLIKFGFQDFGHPVTDVTSECPLLFFFFAGNLPFSIPYPYMNTSPDVDLYCRFPIQNYGAPLTHNWKSLHGLFPFPKENFFIPLLLSAAGPVVKQVLSIIFNDSLQMLWLKIEGGVRMGEGKRYIAVSPFFFQSFEAKKSKVHTQPFHSLLDIGCSPVLDNASCEHDPTCTRCTSPRCIEMGPC